MALNQNSVENYLLGTDWLSPTPTNKEKMGTGEESQSKPLLFADEGSVVRNDLDLKTALARWGHSFGWL